MSSVVTITDPSGVDWPLDGTGGFWEGRGRKGYHGATYQHYRNESPAVAGAFWVGVRALPRELFLPIVIRDTDRNAFLAKRRKLAAAISPVKGACILSTAWPDGSVRRIVARYVDGLDAGEQGPGAYGITVMKYGLRFIADEPYFYSDRENTVWSLSPATRTELPIPGTDGLFEVVSSPLLAGGVTISNPGDVESFPEWTFSGPFTRIVAENTTLDLTWTIEHTAATTTDKLFLNTSPGESALVDGAGTNMWTKLVDGYQLWPLAAGDNTINISLDGPTTGSSATLSYRPRYEAD